MASHDDFGTAECPVARSVGVVGDHWSLLIIRDVFDGIHRFGELQRNLGVAKNILSDRLRTLTSHGVLEMRAASDGSAYREYVLTDRGLELFHVMVALRQWGEAHLFERGEPHSELREKDTDRPVPLLRLVDSGGRPLGPDDAYVRKVGAAESR
jgi:DNA-binding HxlR family transcriptional regulator